MNNKKIFAFCMAIIFGIVFANALHSIELGVCLGLCMAVAFGLVGKEEEGKK